MFGPRDIALDVELVTVANTKAFITLADAKSYCGVTGSGDDTLITSMIDSVCQDLEAYCNAVIAQRTVTEVIWPEDAPTNYILAHAPVISLTSVTIDGVAQTVGDYYLAKQMGLVKRNDLATIAGSKLQFVYSAGYAATPAPFAQAARNLVYGLYNAKNNPAGVKGETLEGVGSTQYGDDEPYEFNNGVALPISVASLIGPFVKQFSP